MTMIIALYYLQRHRHSKEVQTQKPIIRIYPRLWLRQTQKPSRTVIVAPAEKTQIGTVLLRKGLQPETEAILVLIFVIHQIEARVARFIDERQQAEMSGR